MLADPHNTMLLLCRNYYVIGNVYHDGHTFVLYTNGARPPFSVLELWNSLVGTVCHTFRCALRPKLFSRQ